MRKTISLSIGEADKKILNKLCKEKKLLWGGKPSISQLLRNIANRTLNVVSSKLLENQKKAIEKAIELLFAEGEIEFANTLIFLLFEKKAITSGLLDLASNKIFAWHKIIASNIQEKEAFSIIYEENEKLAVFDICFCSIHFKDNKYILKGLCKNILENSNITREFDFANIHNIFASHSAWEEDF